MASFLSFFQPLFLVLLLLQYFGLYHVRSEQLVQAHYLGQFNRSNNTELNDDGYIVDLYFACSVNGTFIHWKYLDIPLRGFHMGQVGVTYMHSVNNFNYTSTLISSKRLTHDNTNQALHSMLIMTFQGDPPTTLQVTCTSDRNYTTLNATNHYSRFKESNGTENNIILNYVLLYIANPQIISIFLCEASHEQQLVDASGLLIGFGRYDPAGRAKTLFSPDGTYATMHSILLSRTSSRTLSIILVPHSDSTVKVACYYDALVHGVSILTGAQSTPQLEPSTTEIISETMGPTETNSAVLSTSILPGDYHSNVTISASSRLVTATPMENTTLLLHHATTRASTVIVILTSTSLLVIVIILLLFTCIYFVKKRKHISRKCTFNEEAVWEVHSKHNDLPMKQNQPNHFKQDQQNNVKQDQSNHVKRDQQDLVAYIKRIIVRGCNMFIWAILSVKPKWKLPDYLHVGYR